MMPAEALFALPHFAFAAGLAALAYLLGRRLTLRHVWDSATEKAAVCTGLGLGALACLVFALGAAGLLYRWALATALVLSAAASWPVWLAPLRRRRAPAATAPRAASPRLPWWRRALWPCVLAAAALLGILPTARLALYPPTSWDAIEYHLAAARIYAAHHGLVFTPYLRYPVAPQLGEMLFTLALVLGDDLDAQLISLLLSLVVGALVLAWARRISGPRAGAWAAAMWFGAAIVVECSSIAYIDVALAAWCALAAYAWLAARERDGAPAADNSSRWLILCGVFAGMAAATKYNGLAFAALLGALVATSAPRAKRSQDALRFGLPALAVALPWYARNAWHTGNPFFPFFGALFGYGPWTREDVQALQLTLAGPGLSRTPRSALTALWHLAFRHGETGFAPLPHGPAAALGAAVGVGAVAAAAWAQGRGARMLAVPILLYLALWFAAAPQVRYLLPILPLVIVLKAVLLDRWLGRVPVLRRPAPLAALTAAGCLLLARDGALHASHLMHAYGPLPITADARAAYLTHEIPSHSYPAYALLNRARGDRYTVYGLYDENMSYYAEGNFIGDWFGPGRFADTRARLGGGPELYRHLRGLGADFLVVVSDRHPLSLPGDPAFAARFREIYSDTAVRLFALRDHDFEVSAAPPPGASK